MVSCQLIGGLGNQMFVSATCIAYSLKHNMGYCLPRKVHHPHYPANKDHSYNFPNLKYCEQELNLPIYTEPHYHYAEIPYMPDVCLLGYWQSWKYFNDYKDEIIKLFGFDGIETKEKICAIHIRRGDYLEYPFHHPTITLSYIDSALNYIGDGFKFKIFSDDIDWCKNHIRGVYGDNVLYSEGNDELTDLREMASCESIITSNSSFSWWGAYINPNPGKKIVMPSVWFGEALNHNTADLYLPNAIII